MTALRFYLVLLLAVFCVTPASADTDAPDLPSMLAQPDITVGDYELAKDDLTAFYAARDNRPAWSFAGLDSNATFAVFINSLQQLIDYHGLPMEDYPFALMKSLAASSDGGVKLELLVTDTLLHLARDLHGDTIDLDQLYPGWNFHKAEVDIPAGLAAAVSVGTLSEFMDGLAPKTPIYAALAQALKTYRALAAKGPWPTIDAGPSLQLKDHGSRVAQLRARLTAEGYLPSDAITDKQHVFFDNNLRDALMEYQAHNGLVSDGHAGTKTVEALNVSVSTRIDQIRANMERWRRVPDDFLPARYVMVNIPNASVDIIEDGNHVYRGPVIIGKVDRKTPFIQSTIRSMIFNPSWHVPKKIAQKDILPKLRKDPHYLEKLGFVIKDSEDDPHGENIDWKSMPEQEFNFRLRQSPGDMNSLGRVKFDFDNDFAVYMHGTPHQELFKKNERSLSSGCVRLRDPEQVAEIVLSGNKEPWPLERIDAEIDSNKTHWVAIANPLPIFIMYWTVFPGDDGKINFRNDIYDYDSFLIQNMDVEAKPEPASAPQPTPVPDPAKTP